MSRKSKQENKISFLSTFLAYSQTSWWDVRNVILVGRGSTSVGTHVCPQESKIRSMSGPLKVIHITAKIAETLRRDINNTHILQSFICKQNVGFIWPHLLNITSYGFLPRWGYSIAISVVRLFSSQSQCLSTIPNLVGTLERVRFWASSCDDIRRNIFTCFGDPNLSQSQSESRNTSTWIKTIALKYLIIGTFEFLVLWTGNKTIRNVVYPIFNSSLANSIMGHLL